MNLCSHKDSRKHGACGERQFHNGDTRDGGNGDEKPTHKVTFTYDFHIGKYEVTFEEYDVFCEATGKSKPSDSGWGRGQRPI
ncbi:MAG: formylglycine-generating enzyme family protein, partial [Thermotogaceae bacterium]|nr:formylglycine-generating enzyme family protein [Thermotogaceae bacterium]